MRIWIIIFDLYVCPSNSNVSTNRKYILDWEYLTPRCYSVYLTSDVNRHCRQNSRTTIQVLVLLGCFLEESHCITRIYSLSSLQSSTRMISSRSSGGVLLRMLKNGEILILMEIFSPTQWHPPFSVGSATAERQGSWSPIQYKDTTASGVLKPARISMIVQIRRHYHSLV